MEPSDIFSHRLHSFLLHLHGKVAQHADDEKGGEDPQLDVDADLGLEDVGDEEAEGLPKPVVAESRSRLLPAENGPVQGCKKVEVLTFLPDFSAAKIVSQ